MIGYCVGRTSVNLRPKIAALVGQGAELLGVEPPLTSRDLTLEDGVLGEGYGLPTLAMGEAVRLAAAQEGLVLDPVYTGKGVVTGTSVWDRDWPTRETKVYDAVAARHVANASARRTRIVRREIKCRWALKVF